MNYRNPHHLRVVTLQSREGTGNVLYPPEFARLASSPASGDVIDPHRSVARETADRPVLCSCGCNKPRRPAPDGPPPTPPWETRQQRAALIVLGVGVFLLALSYLVDGPARVATGAGAFVWTAAAGGVVVRRDLKHAAKEREARARWGEDRHVRALDVDPLKPQPQHRGERR